MRTPTLRYVDPLAQVWLDCAARCGLTVVRSNEVYASYAPPGPGERRGTLTLSDDAGFDADDSLAQMIFHELCHWMTEGEDAYALADWGLENYVNSDAWREHGTLRAQAVLAARYGLRRFFAPTTDYRADFWDHLPADPLADRADPTVQLAILTLRRAATPPWAPWLERALVATTRIAAAFRTDDATSLWSVVDPVPPPHPTGLPADVAPSPSRTCGACAWRAVDDGAERCRQADAPTAAASPGCERWEPALDCQTCGACCRAAYHAVEVEPDDPAVARQPGYVVPIDGRLEVRRAGDRCAALEGGEDVGHTTTTRFRCAIYDDRPRTCREFTLGSEHCLTARRRVGLSL